ncbi:HAMP domain-containing histidine kinase [Dietzia sp. PP-33]|nr:HAMP domain-containing histidine kinase [Dietzia sp. PP-33]
MRTPLTVVDGYVEGIADGVFGIEELRHVRAESARLRRLSEDLSTLSRGAEGRIELALTETDLAVLVRGTVDRLRPQFTATDVELRLVPPEGAVPLVVDPDRVAQVLENLVVNALAATGHGQVTVSVRRTPGGAEISVADTGMGLDAESAERIFERFHRGPGGHAGGSGLGLTIGRQLARAHGGDLTVTSRGPGQGSTFVVSLARTPVGASPTRP